MSVTGSSVTNVFREKKLDIEPEITIPLENFKYSNSNTSEKKKGFLGRTKEVGRLKDYLFYGNKSGDFSGSILVAGYRGAGKTRFVNKVLNEYENERENKEDLPLLKIRINLGSEKNINSKTVLFNMVSLLTDEIKTKLYESDCPNHLVPLMMAGRLSQPVLLLIISFFIFFMLREFSRVPFGSEFLSIDLFLVNPVLMIISLFCYLYMREMILTYSKFIVPLQEIQNLEKEMYATSENSLHFGWGNLGGIGSKVITKPLDNNQIESRLQSIIKRTAKSGFEVIFIFDELDKLSGISADKTNTNLDLIKESQLRKQQVDSILGDLKNLITSSRAVYIFIAGREMYDAYLSERGSSNSLYESLFNDHIYIPSFLTDRSNREIYSLDSTIEAFIVYNLLPEDDCSEGIEVSSLKLAHYS